MSNFSLVLNIALVILNMPVTIWGFTFTPLQMFTGMFFFGLVVGLIKYIFD